MALKAVVKGTSVEVSLNLTGERLEALAAPVAPVEPANAGGAAE